MKNAIVPLLLAGIAFSVIPGSGGAKKSDPRPLRSGPSGESPLAYARGSEFSLRFSGPSHANQSSPSSNKSSANTEILPEGKGRDLMLEACVQCHDFKVVFSQRKTRESWRRTVNEMIWRGAPLVDDEAAQITSYLGSRFGAERGNKN